MLPVLAHVAPQAELCHWKLIPVSPDAPIRPRLNDAPPVTIDVVLDEVPDVGNPAHGTIDVLTEFGALGALLHAVSTAVIVQ